MKDHRNGEVGNPDTYIHTAQETYLEITVFWPSPLSVTVDVETLWRKVAHAVKTTESPHAATLEGFLVVGAPFTVRTSRRL